LNREEKHVSYSENNNLKKTVLEGLQENKFNKTVREADLVCPDCGYLLSAAEASCPNCGFKFREKDKKAEQPKASRKAMAGTVDPWREIPEEEEKTVEGACSLSLVARESEILPVDMTPFSYTGNRIILNRDNTEKENHTITSKEQAALTYEDGKWYIEDKSVMQTTFIHAGQKKEIKSGDVIVLGNRRFVFNDNNE
jgi:DNA-directed RNA polymerase subunit RPC12/RpoP